MVLFAPLPNFDTLSDHVGNQSWRVHVELLSVSRPRMVLQVCPHSGNEGTVLHGLCWSLITQAVFETPKCLAPFAHKVVDVHSWLATAQNPLLVSEENNGLAWDSEGILQDLAGFWRIFGFPDGQRAVRL